MHIQTPGGAKFFVLFTDDHSEYRSVFFLKQKSDVTEAFKEYVSNLRSETGRLIHTLRADNGGEFIAASLKTWLSEKAIRLETSAPHSPEQNGVSERANRTIVEAGRFLLHAKHLPMELWGEAISCAVYTLNRVSNTTSAVTPYQLWYGTKPNISVFSDQSLLSTFPKQRDANWIQKASNAFLLDTHSHKKRTGSGIQLVGS
jgi:transposase InsO family protein